MSPQVKPGGQTHNPGNARGRELRVVGKRWYLWHGSQGESAGVVPKLCFRLSFMRIGSGWARGPVRSPVHTGKHHVPGDESRGLLGQVAVSLKQVPRPENGRSSQMVSQAAP